MTKSGDARPNPIVSRVPATTSKLMARRVFHPPMPLYSPPRSQQHTPQENIDNMNGRDSILNMMDRGHFIGNSSQVEKNVYKQSSKEKDVDSRNKKNLTWTIDMDDYLLDCLLDQMQKGQKIGGNFTKAANLAVAHLVSEKFHIACSSDNVKYRMKTLEKNYFAAKEILSGQYGSGFGFNSSTYMIEANASTWDSYIKNRSKQVHHWEKMDIVYGKDRATGEHAVGPNERVRALDNEENNIEDSSEQCVNEESAIDPEIEPASSTSKKRIHKEYGNKRKRVVDLLAEELRSFREGMNEVAKAINPRNYTEEELFGHIQKINGMSTKNKMKVYQAITPDVILARAFIGCGEEMHKLWISTKFGEDIFDLDEI